MSVSLANAFVAPPFALEAGGPPPATPALVGRARGVSGASGGNRPVMGATSSGRTVSGNSSGARSVPGAT